MPPSGYSPDQMTHIAAMLRSCAGALVIEAADNGETLIEALVREIESIKGYIAKSARTAAERGVLLLTQGFYVEVLAQAPSNRLGFDAAVDAAVRQIDEQVLGIKIPVMRRAL